MVMDPDAGFGACGVREWSIFVIDTSALIKAKFRKLPSCSHNDSSAIKNSQLYIVSVLVRAQNQLEFKMQVGKQRCSNLSFENEKKDNVHYMNFVKRLVTALERDSTTQSNKPRSHSK